MASITIEVSADTESVWLTWSVDPKAGPPGLGTSALAATETIPSTRVMARLTHAAGVVRSL